MWICVSEKQDNAPSWQGEGNRHYDRNIGIMSLKDERRMLIMIRMRAKNAAAIARPSSKDIVQRISASLRRGLRLA